MNFSGNYVNITILVALFEIKRKLHSIIFHQVESVVKILFRNVFSF